MYRFCDLFIKSKQFSTTGMKSRIFYLQNRECILFVVSIASLLRRVVATKNCAASGFHPTVNPCPCVPVRVATHAWVSDTFISPTRFLINEVSLCWTCATLLIQTIFQSPWVWDDIFWFPCIPVAPVQKATLTSGLLRLFQIRVVLQNRDHVGFVQHFFGPTVK